MSLLKEVFKRKPIAESVTGVKLYRIEEGLAPGTEVKVNGKPGIIKKQLRTFSEQGNMYMVIMPGRKVTVASEDELTLD